MSEGKSGRVRLPEDDEVFGVIEQMLGSSRVRVRCEDGNIRIGRIPGRLRKRIWMREGDYVIVEPWDIQGDEKGDVVWRYTKTQASRLKKEGKLDKLEGRE